MYKIHMTVCNTDSSRLRQSVSGAVLGESDLPSFSRTADGGSLLPTHNSLSSTVLPAPGLMSMDRSTPELL